VSLLALGRAGESGLGDTCAGREIAGRGAAGGRPKPWRNLNVKRKEVTPGPERPDSLKVRSL